MSGALAHIFRYPIKAHGREALASVSLSVGACLSFDRRWAVMQRDAQITRGDAGSLT